MDLIYLMESLRDNDGLHKPKAVSNDLEKKTPTVWQVSQFLRQLKTCSTFSSWWFQPI